MEMLLNRIGFFSFFKQGKCSMNTGQFVDDSILTIGLANFTELYFS